MELKAILFDMDDTLIDWSDCDISWEVSYREHMKGVYHYYQGLLDYELDPKEFLDQGWKHVITQWEAARNTLEAPNIANILFEMGLNLGLDAQQIDRDKLIEAYTWNVFPGVSIFPEVLSVLDKFRKANIKIGLVTNAAQPIGVRQRELDAFGISPFLDPYCQITAADVGYLKPHRAIFERALEFINAEPEEAIFVGDSVSADIVGAQSVGMKAVLRKIIDKPFRIENEEDKPQIFMNGEIVQPDGIIDTLEDLFPILDEWYPRWRG